VELPRIELELLEDLTPAAPTGFLRLMRHRYRALYPDGTESAPFVYDSVDRAALDAVVLAAHYVDAAGQRCLYLRSAVRPPVAARDPARSPHPERDPPHGLLWELPAGLVEADEQSPAGLRRASQRELGEELGFSVEVDAFRELGASMFPVPGMIAERIYVFEVAVNPKERAEPSLDGSALEQFGVVVALPVSDVLELCRSGAILDLKTELAVRRLLERYGAGSTP
jgi:ADP-ribose pyrophosphatase